MQATPERSSFPLSTGIPRPSSPGSPLRTLGLITLAALALATPTAPAAPLPIAELPPIPEGFPTSLYDYIVATSERTKRPHTFSPDAAVALGDKVITSADIAIPDLSPAEIFRTVLVRNGLNAFYDGSRISFHLLREEGPELLTFDQERMPTLRQLLVPLRLNAEEFSSSISLLPAPNTNKIIVTGSPGLRALVGKYTKELGQIKAPKVAPTYRWEVRRLKHAYATTTTFKGSNDRPFVLPGVIDQLTNLIGLDDAPASALFPLATSPPGQDASQPARLSSLTGNQGATRTDFANAQAFALVQEAANSASQAATSAFLAQQSAADTERESEADDYEDQGQEIRSNDSFETARVEIGNLLDSNPTAVLGYFRTLSRAVQSALILDLDAESIARLEKILPPEARRALNQELNRDPSIALGEALKLGVNHNPSSTVPYETAQPVLRDLVDLTRQKLRSEASPTRQESPIADSNKSMRSFSEVQTALQTQESRVDLLANLNSAELVQSLINAFQDLRAEVQSELLRNLDETRAREIEGVLSAELDDVFREQQRRAVKDPFGSAVNRVLKGQYGSNPNSLINYETARAELRARIDNPNLTAEARSRSVFAYYQDLRPEVQERLIAELPADRLEEIKSLLDSKHRDILEGLETQIRTALQNVVALLPPLTVTDVKRTIFADSSQNAIVMFDTDGNIKFYNHIIDQLDVPVKLVEVSVAIIDISTDAGIDWQSGLVAGAAGDLNNANISGIGGSNSNGPGLLGNLGNGAAPPAAPGVPPAAGALGTTLANTAGLNVSTLIVGSSYRILSRIKALETQGDARILSRPMVMTLDNVQAYLDDKVIIHVPVAGLENSELYQINAGTAIRVLPHIMETEDKNTQIRIAVHIEEGSPTIEEGVALDGIPLITEGNITTQAVIPENQSLMIGGRYRAEEISSEGRVPFLGRIPVLGVPFKDKRVTKRKFQRFFLITPKVIDPLQMHASSAERAHDILTIGSQAGSGQDPTPHTGQEWNQKNEALFLDAGRAADMPGQTDEIPEKASKWRPLGKAFSRRSRNR